jgi:hypothetical protein
MTEDKLKIPPQWTVQSTDEAEEIPLLNLEEVNFSALKLRNNRPSGPEGLNLKILKVEGLICPI